LLLGLLMVSGLGLTVLYSAGQQNMDLVSGQGMRLGLGFAIMLTLAQLPPRYFRLWSPWIYLGGICAVAGGHGGRRYFQGRAALAGFGGGALSAFGNHETGRADDDGLVFCGKALAAALVASAGRGVDHGDSVHPDRRTAGSWGRRWWSVPPARLRCFWPG
jgi:hypothetical protein